MTLLNRLIEMVSADASGAHTLAGRLTHQAKLLKAEILVDMKRQDQARAVLGALRDQIDALPADHATRRRVEDMPAAIERSSPSLPSSVPANEPQSTD